MSENPPEGFVANLCEELDALDVPIAMYVVGSAVYRAPSDIGDVDIWLIDSASQSKRQIRALNLLRASILKGESTFSVPSESHKVIQACVSGAIQRSIIGSGGPTFECCYGIGPADAMLKQKMEMLIHICGAISVEENRHFFKAFPFHGRAFLTKHIRVRGPELRDLVHWPDADREEFRRWVNALALRERASSGTETRMKIARKAVLTHYLFKRHPSAYEMADGVVASLVRRRFDWTKTAAILTAIRDQDHSLPELEAVLR